LKNHFSLALETVPSAAQNRFCDSPSSDNEYMRNIRNKSEINSFASSSFLHLVLLHYYWFIQKCHRT